MSSSNNSLNISREEELCSFENNLPKSQSCLSVNDCATNNTSPQLYYTIPDRFTSKSVLGHYSSKRRKKSGNFESLESNSAFTNFVSDPLQGNSTEENMKNGNSSECIVYQQEDELDALRELDAVLDIHDTSLAESAASKMGSETDQTNIEECLLDLDDYLNKMDENKLFDNSKSTTKADDVFFCRGDFLRKTEGCIHPKKKLDSDGHDCVTLLRTNSELSIDNKNRRNDSLEQQLSEIATSRQDFSGPQNSENRPCLLRHPESTGSSTQVLTEDQIFQNLIEQNESNRVDTEYRPRQYGRRAERNSQATLSEGHNNDNMNVNLLQNVRPMSAYATSGQARDSSEQLGLNSTTVYNGSDGSTGRSSHNTSPVTIVSSSESSEMSTASHNRIESELGTNEECAQQSEIQATDSDIFETSQKPGFNTHWPHNFSRTLALTSTTLGLFNICRFSVLTVNYGPNFLIQFLCLSIIFGIPFFWLQMCLGAKIKAGPVSMWKISPICSGIGISLVLVQYFVAIYSSVVIVWLLVYLGDTLKYQSSYRWAQKIHYITPGNSSQTYYNLTESVPDYFNFNVLQRLQMLKLVGGKDIRLHISDRLAFLLAMLWTCVFLILCKGLRSFGKILFVIGILPLIALAVVTGKLLHTVDLTNLQNVFSSSEFDDFLINSKSWSVAAQETFFTWGLLGASVIAITSRSEKNQSKMALRRDAIIVVFLTLIGLSLSALIGLCCVQIINQSGYVYVPGSYENPGCYTSVYSLKSPMNSNIISYPAKLVPHYSSFIGDVYRRHPNVKDVSGYQVLRLVSELFPAMLAIAGDNFSWIWASVVFIMLFIFGVAQLCVMWKPISSALGNSTSAVLLSCVTGLLLSIPFATEVGITLLHYMDSLIGGAWFIPILWAAEIFGVFLIRGRPYNGDDLVNDLKMSGSMSAFLALSWNVLLPISLITLAIIEYKISLSSQIYYWRGRSYYTYWTRKVGALTQIGFLLLVPITAIIQIYRYLTTGPPDILDRIQMLYRPLSENGARVSYRTQRDNSDSRYSEGGSGTHDESGGANLQDDAPPKYTPPPSYTTATGARLAKLLRQSIRRSYRRIMGDTNMPRPILSIQTEQNDDQLLFPPHYSTVLTHQTATSNDEQPSTSEIIEIGNINTSNSIFGRSLSLGRMNILQKHRLNKMIDSRRPSSASRANTDESTTRPYTAEDVITTLRSSTRIRNGTSHLIHQQNPIAFRSFENLVLNAEPPGISSVFIHGHSNENDNKNTSVI